MGQQELRLQSQIARLFARAGATADADTVAKYEAVAASFGPDYESAGPSTEDRYRYADSLVAAGVLERRVTPLSKNGIACGCLIEYRRVQLQAIAA